MLFGRHRWANFCHANVVDAKTIHFQEADSGSLGGGNEGRSSQDPGIVPGDRCAPGQRGRRVAQETGRSARELDSQGHDTAAARQLLIEFCTLLRRHHLDWVRVGQELREADRPLLRWPSSAEGK